MFRWLAAVGAISLLAACAPGYPDDKLVRTYTALRQSVVLLTMRVPPDDPKTDLYDDAFATGTVVASGAWGSDILTVEHAVDRAWDMHATIGNRRKVRAEVVSEDAKLDIALVRTRTPYLPVAKLGSSAQLAAQVGRNVALIGYPIPDAFQDEDLGLATSLATGDFSATRKGALEVTLPIVPGESGAPVLLIDSGEIIGIAESRFDSEPSIGFALPIDDAKEFLHKHDAIHGF